MFWPYQTAQAAATSRNLANQLKALAGKLFITETTKGGWGAGQHAAPRRDYETTRLGANFARRAWASLRGDVKADIFGAYGIPSSVHGTGGSARESYTVSSCPARFSRCPGSSCRNSRISWTRLTLAFDFTEMRAADIASRARAYSQLVGAQMDPDQSGASHRTGLAMPVTITVDQLAVAVRVSADATVPVEEPDRSILARLLASSAARVELYAEGAPDDTLNSAVVKMALYNFDQPSVPRNPANAFTNSGAEALLAAFHGPSFATV